MSRNYRGRVFTPRWGKSTIDPRKKKFTTQEQVDYLNRVVRRANRAAGYLSDEKLPSEWHFQNGDPEHPQTGTVVAHTKSEARALIKREMNISKNRRLPQSVIITKGEVCQTAN